MAERKLAKRRKMATQETGGTKRSFPPFGRQEEIPPPRAPQPLPAPRAPFEPASGSGIPPFSVASGACFQCGHFGHIKRNCPTKGLVTGSLYPSHESDEGIMGGKGIDYEGNVTPDSEDECSRCWDFQLDVSLSNGKNSVKGRLGKCIDF